jgi:class 3 adenylate cyclase
MSRRLVVVLFLDLVGWTSLAERVDPEPLEQLLERYYEICSDAVREHGGDVEKFIGDAVMAVFGAGPSQEDDAARALRTATQILAQVTGLRLGGAAGGLALNVHCGIAAGEALVNRSPRAGLRVVGDVVNLAARLQSAAAAGQILVNITTADLAREQFTVAEIAPLTVKGKAEPVRVFQAAGPAPAGRSGPDSVPIVDRGAERGLLRAAYQETARSSRARLVAVLGPSGIGKTRLIRELVNDLAAAGPERPLTLFGDCPSHGPGRNYAALSQVLQSLTSQSQASAELARDDRRIATVLASLAGDGPRPADGPGPGREEVTWAVRELCAAAARPVVVVLDSLEWAGPSLLHLIGELAAHLRQLPVLLICAARPELAQAQVPWIRGLGHGDVIDVGALALADATQLARGLAAAGHPGEVLAHGYTEPVGGSDWIGQLALYSAGNPLFIRLLLDSAVPGQPLASLPPTITAMVGAMLDRLPEHLQRLLGTASVIGSTFTLDELAVLGQPAPALGVAALVERGLVRPTEQAGAYAFVQQPVHEVAYGRLEKERRCAWHRQLAEHGSSTAFHLDLAVRLLRDLRPDDAGLPGLASQAAAALLAEGTAALRQRDLPASIGLLDRALDLAPAGPGPQRALAAIRLSDALLLSGNTRRAVEVAAEAGRDSPAGQVRRSCRVQQQLAAARLGPVPAAAVAALFEEMRADPEDHLSWSRFEQLLMLVHLEDGHFGAAERALCAALVHVRSLGDPYEEDRLLAALCEVRQWSPAPVAEKLASCAELLRRFAADRFLLVPVLASQARCLALAGRGGEARAALTEAAVAVEQLQLTMGQVLIDQANGLCCSLDGQRAAAEAHFLLAADALERAGNQPVALTMRVLAAREAAQLRAPETVAPEIAALLARRDEMNLRGRLLCLAVSARLAACAGIADPGLDAVPVLAADTDDPCLRGDVCFELAQAHRLLGQDQAAAEMAAAAAASYAGVGATRPLELVLAWT